MTDTVDGDDPEPVLGALAWWVEGASQPRRDAHYRSQRWSHELPRQVEQLHQARARALASHERVRESGNYPDEARWPFMEMDAEAHYLLVAARQLLRSLRAFDGNDRLPSGLSAVQLRQVRDALEHWDEDGGSRAARALAAQGADAFSHRWALDGRGVIGDVVSDAVLGQWGADVYAELLHWDPYDGWQ